MSAIEAERGGSELAERLTGDAQARVLVVNCDDLGMCHAANEGVYHSLRDGFATSASLMVPCPWAREAAAQYRGEDVGVHLTLTAEWELYRWGPITQAPSLLGGDGGFPRTVADAWDHADLDEVRRELRSQVERAILWGFDVTHLDSHMGTLQLRPEFFDVYLDLAVDFGLPLRLSGASTQAAVGFPFRELAAQEGVLAPDHLLYTPGVGARDVVRRVARRSATGRHRGVPPPGDRSGRAACPGDGLGATRGRSRGADRPPQPGGARRAQRGAPGRLACPAGPAARRLNAATRYSSNGRSQALHRPMPSLRARDAAALNSLRCATLGGYGDGSANPSSTIARFTNSPSTAR